MKLKHIFSAIAGLLLTAAMTGCDEEKDFVVIDGNLPIKTSTLYMVGDATPGGWSLDDATRLQPTEADALVFTYEGNLNSGEMKLCLTPTGWDVAFIRPENNGEEITKASVANRPFVMYAGDPDNKWRIAESGKYRLTFDLRNWTMASEYLGAAVEGPSEPVIFEPVVTDVFYIVGEATPSGWNIDAPTPTVKTADYTFVYEGQLEGGEMKACISTGDWGAPFVRPSFNGCKIGKSGVESADLVFAASPDDKWIVETAGIYRLTFDLEHGKLAAEYLGEPEGGEKTPIETATLYMIGDATPNGWSMDGASEFEKSSENPYIFTWVGNLVQGSMKACTERDGTFSCPFLRPSSNGVEISSAGVASPDFVYTKNPDDQWRITEDGTYRITFDLENWTITAEKLN